MGLQMRILLRPIKWSLGYMFLPRLELGLPSSESKVLTNYATEPIALSEGTNGKKKFSWTRTRLIVKGFEPLPPQKLVPKTSAIDHSATLLVCLINLG